MPKRRRAVLLVAVSCLFASALVAQAPDSRRFHTDRPQAKLLPLPKEEGVFHFAIFGDRTGGPRDGVKVLAQAVDDVNLLAPDLVMTVGDLVEGYTDEKNWRKEADEYTSIMGRLRMPWFPVAGNHDVYYRGPNKERLGNDDLFEGVFGPLWYAFQHKNCWFIALYSDEGDLETGVKNFRVPQSHVMSPAQFAFLEETLQRAKGAEHVFVFLHHPRWLVREDDRSDYGRDWDRVHALLKDAGNVSAVFAGHIHRMRYDGRRDGIEYFALGATGGSLSTDVPKAGFLHHYLIVTVRKDRVDAASLPVGAVFDPRAMDPSISNDVLALARKFSPRRTTHGVMDARGAVDSVVEVSFENPTSRPIEVTLTSVLKDPTFEAVPDHVHKIAPPGTTQTISFRLYRDARSIDSWFEWPTFEIQAELLTETSRIAMPPKVMPIAMKAPYALFCDADAPDRALLCDGVADHVVVENDRLRALETGPFTIEGKLRGGSFKGRRGFICNTEQSGYGIFVSDGKPTFSVFLGAEYASAEATAALLKSGVWSHVAGVYDGEEVRLYVDGALVASKKAAGVLKANRFPLLIGADINSKGGPMSFFDGAVDEIRISKNARYSGPKFDVPSRHAPDADTLLLLRCDGARAKVLPDASPRSAHVMLRGNPAFVAP